MRTDIDFSFKPHPLTGDLATKKGSSAIKQSLINLIRTNYYDRGMNVEVGTNVDGALFENVTLLTSQQIRSNIENSIRNFEPNVELVDVEVVDGGENELTATIYYTELNNPVEQSISINLSRVR